ncbi:MAG: hypothetical protein WDZ94_05710 [Patescibacteria group bacterium]
MKVYFTASLRGNLIEGLDYKIIYKILEKSGHTHLDSTLLNSDIQEFYNNSASKQLNLYKKTHENIGRADVVILEVSVPSLSMGYVLHKALDASKPVILLYKKGFDPHFAMSIQHDKLQVLEYDDANLERDMNTSLEIAQENADVRFNFFIPPKIGRYLDWISKFKKIPRSVYLRSLIEDDMRANQDYSDTS